MTEQLIFNKWKVGEVIEFPDVEVNHWCKTWKSVDNYCSRNLCIADFYKAIKTEIFKGEEHLCFDSNIEVESYFMIPKSELIRIGMLEETKEEKVFGDTFKESRNKALNQSYHPSKETKEEMKSINGLNVTFKEAKEAHEEIKDSHSPYFIKLKAQIESQFPELKPKLITDLVTSATSAYDYCLERQEFATEEENKSVIAFTQIQLLAHVLNEDWVADWKDTQQTKYQPVYDYQIRIVTFISTRDTDYGTPVFKSKELLQHVINHNPQLIKDLFKVKG